MKIEVVLTETDLAEEFADALAARDLPEKFFYWFPLSLRAWLALVRDPAQAAANQSWRIISDRIPPHVRHIPDPLAVISFGAGEGSKDRVLLAALQSSGRQLRYFPVDSSQALLELACAAGEDDNYETTGVKADISSPMHLVFASDAAESPKLLVMAGNTLGAFDPVAQIRYMTDCLHAGDRLLLDGELYADDTVARHTAAARDFVSATLSSIGFSAADGEVLFSHRADERHAGLHMIARHFRASRDLRAWVGRPEILIARGERIGLNFKYAYSQEAFRWLISQTGRLRILEELCSPEHRLIAAVCEREA